ncbi:NERD domain-containing protein [Ornithinibacillus sp. L9]|uniref:NERD domain-containing protein n=1 Tax=Ornithinibacillus caprae TaxID=2678566 RepID=A0A6N8FJ95_9BACI|nr:nuclease-related domain-containing protein [Ornithinibacillus caprae]MUK89680.1 NERD domain-containing protein [Ornithinibacillus caprae]
MINKFRTKPHIILCFEALFRFLKKTVRNSNLLLEEYASYLAGYRGEKATDYTLSIYPHKNSWIYQDLRLNNGPFHFQIDTLIVTAKLIIILEIKNLRGELEYDSRTQQLIQKYGNVKKRHKSPILQAEAQKMNLIKWLNDRGFPPIPIETIAVISNPSSILVNVQDDPSIFNKLINLENLPPILNDLFDKYNVNRFDKKTITELNNYLLNAHNPLDTDLIKQFNVTENNLIKGIPCSKCEHYPMVRQNKTWFCQKCHHVDSKAHERVILDYFLLFNTTITNKECRELLQLKSSKTAYRLLRAMNLESTGNNSARKYHAPPLHEFPQNSSIPNDINSQNYNIEIR